MPPTTTRVALAASALACGEGGSEAGGRAGGEFWPQGIAEYEFIPTGQPDSPVLRLRTERDRWVLRLDRESEGWEASEDLATLEVEAPGGTLRVDGTLLVPDPVVEGQTQDGLTVESLGEVEVWYGAFPDAFAGQAAEGRLEGDLAFAAAFGPIRLTVDLVTWELAAYVPAEP